MDRKFVQDCIKVIAMVIIGGFLIGTLANVFKVDPPTYVTNVTQPCVIAPVILPADETK